MANRDNPNTEDLVIEDLSPTVLRRIDNSKEVVEFSKDLPIDGTPMQNGVPIVSEQSDNNLEKKDFEFEGLDFDTLPSAGDNFMQKWPELKGTVDHIDRFAKQVFPTIPHPEDGYHVGDLVGHVDHIAYEIFGIAGSDLYDLGYKGAVRKRCSKSEFRKMIDITNALFQFLEDNHMIDETRVVRLGRQPKDEDDE